MTHVSLRHTDIAGSWYISTHPQEVNHMPSAPLLGLHAAAAAALAGRVEACARNGIPLQRDLQLVCDGGDPRLQPQPHTALTCVVAELQKLGMCVISKAGVAYAVLSLRSIM